MSAESVDLAGLLRELETRWLSQDAELVGALSPGLTAAEIDRVMVPAGVALPEEARTWFGWHNGNVELSTGWSGPQRFHRRIGGSTMEFLSLEWAVNEYYRLVDVAMVIAGAMGCTPAVAGWDASWFPIFQRGNGSVAGIDCSVSGLESPIRLVSKADEHPEDIDAPSLTQVVRWWLELYESGGYSWDGSAWQINFEATAWLQPTGLV